MVETVIEWHFHEDKSVSKQHFHEDKSANFSRSFGDHPQGRYTISRAGQAASASLDTNEEPSYAQ